MQQITSDQVVLLSQPQWNAVQAVLNRLYDVRSLSGDQKRDLANYLEANLADVMVEDIDKLMEIP